MTRRSFFSVFAGLAGGLFLPKSEPKAIQLSGVNASTMPTTQTCNGWGMTRIVYKKTSSGWEKVHDNTARWTFDENLNPSQVEIDLHFNSLKST